MILPDTERGAYAKYTVYKNDEHGNPMMDHESDYFVLDLINDPLAADALRAYANSCKEEYPLLSSDLLRAVERAKLAVVEKKIQQLAAKGTN